MNINPQDVMTTLIVLAIIGVISYGVIHKRNHDYRMKQLEVNTEVVGTVDD